MTTFYAKSKMANPEYRYNILNTDFKPVYETDGRLRLGGKSVVFTKADTTEEKVITVSRVPDTKHHYTADFADGRSASLERLEWKPFHPSISIKTADAEFLFSPYLGFLRALVKGEDGAHRGMFCQLCPGSFKAYCCRIHPSRSPRCARRVSAPARRGT